MTLLQQSYPVVDANPSKAHLPNKKREAITASLFNDKQHYFRLFN
jgi:hypothetical protein